MTRLPPRAQQGFPDLASCPEECAELPSRWEAVLARAPRLRPWLEEMVREQRARKSESAHDSIERALWYDLERWVRQFEALPQFAAAAISVTLEERPAPRPPVPEAAAPAASPERTVDETEALLADPAFALAFHCIDARVRPALQGPLPLPAWFGLLHASSQKQALLTPEVVVGLVLRLLGADFARLPPGARKAALRLFHAAPADLRAEGRVAALCAALPAEWNLDAAGAPAFVASAARARKALEEACGLCARIAASARKTQGGGLSVLKLDGALPAAPEELKEVAETARRFAGMAGLHRLLGLLPGFFASGDGR